jgi:hypothetical protein
MQSDSYAWSQEIDALFLKYGSDRGSHTSTAKNFHKLYGALFVDSRRRVAEVIVEVGSGGAGLRTWSHYFKKAQVLGVHNHPGQDIKGEDRIITVPCNAASRRHTPQEHWEPFIGSQMVDIMIDNSQDTPLEQAQILHNMYGNLRDGGIYIVEEFRKKSNCVGGCHHFCNLRFDKPFTDNDRAKGNTSGRLQDELSTRDMFFASMKSGQLGGSSMILLKNWSNFEKPFHSMMHNYHIVYNAFLSTVPIRNIMSYRSLNEQMISSVACGGAYGIDLFVASTRNGQNVLPNILSEFSRSKAGSYLFIEEASFSFCKGAPDPTSGYWGDGIQSIVSSNPDWFYVMTQDDAYLHAKMLVVRKS